MLLLIWFISSVAAKGVHCLLPWRTWMVPFGAMRARPQGEDIEVSYLQVPSHPVSEGHDLLSSRDLPFPPGYRVTKENNSLSWLSKFLLRNQLLFLISDVVCFICDLIFVFHLLTSTHFLF